jgi:hypothetical protein
MAFSSIEVNWLPAGNMVETGASCALCATHRLAKYTYTTFPDVLQVAWGVTLSPRDSFSGRILSHPPLSIWSPDFKNTPYIASQGGSEIPTPSLRLFISFFSSAPNHWERYLIP